MDNTWRSGMPRDLRQQNVDRIMESLQIPLDKHPTYHMVREDALHVEEEIFLAAADQSDYAMRISVRMLALETAGVANIGMAEATDIQESPGGVPIQNLSDGGPLQKAVSGEEGISADISKAMVTNASPSVEEEVSADCPDAMVTNSSSSGEEEVSADFSNATVTDLISRREELLAEVRHLTGVAQALFNEIVMDSSSSVNERLTEVLLQTTDLGFRVEELDELLTQRRLQDFPNATVMDSSSSEEEP